jgi:hypothetical protein
MDGIAAPGLTLIGWPAGKQLNIGRLTSSNAPSVATSRTVAKDTSFLNGWSIESSILLPFSSDLTVTTTENLVEKVNY